MISLSLPQSRRRRRLRDCQNNLIRTLFHNPPDLAPLGHPPLHEEGKVLHPSCKLSRGASETAAPYDVASDLRYPAAAVIANRAPRGVAIRNPVKRERIATSLRSSR